VSRGVLDRVVDELGASLDRTVALETLAPPLPAYLWLRRSKKKDSCFVRALGVLAPRLAGIDPRSPQLSRG
jgi:hypothetical protein